MKDDLVYTGRLLSGYEKAERGYWWFTARRRIIMLMVDRYLPSRGGRVLDIGCGPGTTLGEWEKRGKGFGLDRSHEAARMAGKKNGNRAVQGDATRLPFKAGSFDIVASLDVLEHLDDPEASLEEMNRVCRPGGMAVITVPAYQFLYHPCGDYGHRKRYIGKEVRGMVEGKGFRVIRLTYFNTFFFPLMALQRLFGSREPGDRDLVDAVLPRLPRVINRSMDLIFGSEAYFLRAFDFPFGGSILCICEKSRT